MITLTVRVVVALSLSSSSFRSSIFTTYCLFSIYDRHTTHAYNKRTIRDAEETPTVDGEEARSE